MNIVVFDAKIRFYFITSKYFGCFFWQGYEKSPLPKEGQWG